MKYFYYLKTSTQELVYQDDEIALPTIEKETVLERQGSQLSKAELTTEISKHKIAIYDAKNDTSIQIEAKDASCLIRWDGISPYYELVKGTEPSVIPFAGWPQVSKDNYVAPTEEPIPE